MTRRTFSRSARAGFNTPKLRRLYEAARKGREENRFWDDLDDAFADGTIEPSGVSIREVFEQFVPDGRELLRYMDPRDQSGFTLREAAVNTGAFANISGQIVYSTIMQGYDEVQLIGDSLVQTISTQFNGEKIPGVTGLGDVAESIGEGKPYPTAGVGEEWVETPSTTKRGIIVPITKEAIFFDRTNLVVQRARDVGKSLAVNKEKRIMDEVTGETVSYKRNGVALSATYGNNSGTHDFDNLAASNALQDWTDLDAVYQLMNKMTDPNTGEPIMVTPNTILVPQALEAKAKMVVGAIQIRLTDPSNTDTYPGTETIASNPVGQGLQIATSPYVYVATSSDTTWYMGDFKSAFAYMENWPITVVEAPPNSELEFTNDIVMRFKASERGTVATLDPRYVVKCTA
jgi:hypothetical protein